MPLPTECQCVLCSALLSSLGETTTSYQNNGAPLSSLAQKRAGVGVGFQSVLKLAMTVCTHKPPTNLDYRQKTK